MKTLAEKLNRLKIRQLAGSSSFERGEDYFESGRARIFMAHKA